MTKRSPFSPQATQPWQEGSPECVPSWTFLNSSYEPVRGTGSASGYDDDVSVVLLFDASDQPLITAPAHRRIGFGT
jgi:hypothetical protein